MALSASPTAKHSAHANFAYLSPLTLYFQEAFPLTVESGGRPKFGPDLVRLPAEKKRTHRANLAPIGSLKSRMHWGLDRARATDAHQFLALRALSNFS